MTVQTRQEEKIIGEVLALLEEKHAAYEPEPFEHYIVKGEYEEECDSNSYCEDCIDAAVKEKERDHYKKRAHKRLLIKYAKKNGFCFTWGWDPNLEAKYLVMQTLTAYQIRKFVRQVNKEYPDKVHFSYRYFQRDSASSFRHCDSCGKIISACITADEQEIEHWESLEDHEFIVSDMDVYSAYELYEIMQFIHQADEAINKRGVLLAEKIGLLNGIQAK